MVVFRPTSPGLSAAFREFEHDERHLVYLYEIGKLLGQFEDLEHTLPRLMALVTQVLPVRTALLLEGVDADGQPLQGQPRLSVWRITGVSDGEFTRALEQASAHYAYLLGMTGVRPPDEAEAAVEAPGTWQVPEPAPPAEPTRISLPLVCRSRVSGTLQVEVAGAPLEQGLAFIDSVAHQLALALERAYALRRERWARREGEAALARKALLAEAGALLSQTLDCRESLPEVARLLVPAWAEGCVIDLFPGEAPEPQGTERVARRMAEPGPPEAHPWMALPTRGAGSGGMERAEWPGIPANLRLPLIARGRVLGVMGLMSAQPGRYDAATTALLETLAQHIAAAVDTEHLSRRAQQAVRWREELLAVVAQELKTPLLRVKLNAENLVRASLGGERPPRQDQLLTSILQSAERMHEFVGGLLERSQEEGLAAPLLVRSQRVEVLLEKVLHVLRPLALGKAQRLNVVVSPGLRPVLADAERIQHVLGHLVGNAIKFTPSGGSLTLRAQPFPGQVRFCVRDTGPGIPCADLPHLFERSTRAAPGRSRGLGLVRGLVEAHGGTLWVESAPGEGSTFFFTLPAAEAAGPG